MAETKIQNSQVSGAVFRQFDQGSNLGKASRAWVEVMSASITPNVSGEMISEYRASFGFDTSARTSSFRMKINGTIVIDPQPQYATAAQWSLMVMYGRLSNVTAGTTYTISIEANHTSCYVQDQQIVTTVTNS